MKRILLLITLILFSYSSISCMKKIFRPKQKLASNEGKEKKYAQDKLFKAINSGEHHTLENLLKSKSDPNIYNNNRRTPLSSAVKKNDYKSVKKLLNYGALCTLDLPGNMTLVHLVTNNNINEQSLKILQILIANKAPLSVKAHTGFTPLHYAVINEQSSPENKLKCIQLLLESGSSYNEPSSTGLTPLHVAISIAHNDELAQFFIHSTQTNINALTIEEQTPLMYAIEHRMMPTIISLLSNPSIQIDHRDKQGKSASDYAKQYEQEEVDALLNKHKNFNS